MTVVDRLADLWTRFVFWLRELTGASGAARPSLPDRAALVDLLQDGQTGQRWLAAEALAQGDPGRSGISMLESTMEYGDPILRWEAGNALAQAGGNRVRDGLVQMLADDDRMLQCTAADALGRMPADEKTAAALQALLDSQDAAVRQCAAEALARAGKPRPGRQPELASHPVPRLLSLLAEDPDPMARRAAALALGRWGGAAERESLQQRVDDHSEDSRVREAAALALSRLPQTTETASLEPVTADSEAVADEATAPEQDQLTETQ